MPSSWGGAALRAARIPLSAESDSPLREIRMDILVEIYGHRDFGLFRLRRGSPAFWPYEKLESLGVRNSSGFSRFLRVRQPTVQAVVAALNQRRAYFLRFSFLCWTCLISRRRAAFSRETLRWCLA